MPQHGGRFNNTRVVSQFLFSEFVGQQSVLHGIVMSRVERIVFVSEEYRVVQYNTHHATSSFSCSPCWFVVVVVEETMGLVKSMCFNRVYVERLFKSVN